MKMKQCMVRTMAMVLLAVIIFPLNGLDTYAAGKAKTTAKIAISRSDVTLYVGKKKTIKLKNVTKKQAKKIKWTSSKKSVASVSVSSGSRAKAVIKAKKAGKATITAKLLGKKYKCKVTVKKKKTSGNNQNGNNQNGGNQNSGEGTQEPKIIYIEVPVKEEEDPVPEGNLTYQSDVTNDMTKASYWYGLCKNPNEVLIDAAGIEAMNQSALAAKETNMNDLLNREENYNPDARKQALAAAIESDVKIGRVGDHKIYLDGVEVKQPDQFFDDIKANILNAATGTEGKIRYGLCVKRADLKMAPVSESVGWSASDADDEFMDDALNVNDPFIVEAVTADGKFYWGRSKVTCGWVEAERIAICDDKEVWKSMWTGTGENILVITADKIVLEASNFDKATSNLKLTFGTVLPLVPGDQLPGNIYERGTWYNYVVYVPSRDENGKFVRNIALISMNNNVSVGYLPFTQKNLLKTAFNCLGNRYGWGGMLDAMDCSLYTRMVYRCFGFELPRNTTWQELMPSDNVDLSKMTDEEKKEAIRSCEPGTLLKFSGHIMMYIGEVDGKLYVISDLGSASETEAVSEEVNVQSIYCVSINSLDVRRRSGHTWLTDLTSAIRPWKTK